MNQALYDLTDTIGREMLWFRQLLTQPQTEGFVRTLARSSLLSFTMPNFDHHEQVMNALLQHMLGQQYGDNWMMCRRILDKLIDLMRPLVEQAGGRMMTIVNVEFTPAQSYQLTVGYM